MGTRHEKGPYLYRNFNIHQNQYIRINIFGNHKLIVDALKEEQGTAYDISKRTKLELRVVKNIVMELIDAGVVRRSDTGVISMKTSLPKPKTGREDQSIWTLDGTPKHVDDNQEGRLKNLSRIV